MKATAIYDAKGYDNRIALFDDGLYRPCNYYGNGHSKTQLSAESIEDMASVGYLTDISDTEEGREVLDALNAYISRHEILAETGRAGGRKSTPAKRAAATRREASRRSSPPPSPSPLVSVVELRRRILAYIVADEAAHGRGALPSKTRAALLTSDALGYRRELAAKLAALPADADPREALRELIAGHPHSAKRERWRWLLLRDPTAQP